MDKLKVFDLPQDVLNTIKKEIHDKSGDSFSDICNRLNKCLKSYGILVWVDVQEWNSYWYFQKVPNKPIIVTIADF